jgi:hypothetical protein
MSRRSCRPPKTIWARCFSATRQPREICGLKLARIRRLWERLQPRQALLFADELDIQLLPKSGYPWMEKGTQVEVLTPGQNEKRYWAGAWDRRTGQVHYRLWARQTNGLFRALLEAVETAYPARR